MRANAEAGTEWAHMGLGVRDPTDAVGGFAAGTRCGTIQVAACGSGVIALERRPRRVATTAESPDISPDAL